MGARLGHPLSGTAGTAPPNGASDHAKLAVWARDSGRSGAQNGPDGKPGQAVWKDRRAEGAAPQ